MDAGIVRREGRQDGRQDGLRDGAAAGADPIIVRLRGIEKTFDGEALVVRGVDLDIRRGEFLTLLGPSGSGKTTILMMLAGFETPTRGEIVIDGRPVGKLPPHKRDIGIVFQSYALFPHMSVAENLSFPLQVRKRPRGEIRERVERALSIVRLEGLGARRPNQLSGGQQQRVALARALVFEPKLVLMDEPLGALDKQLREHMQLEIKHIHERLGVTFVYVTHDQTEALTMSDRVAVMSQGVIEQLDTPERVYEAPLNAFVAHFIGENNRLPGRVLACAGETCTVEVADGWRIEALAIGKGAVPGAATTVSLRPERVQMGEAAAACANRFDAEVIELVYLGDHTRMRLAACGQDGFVLKVAHSAGPPHLRPGERISIGFAIEDCRALDEA
ncbi:MAG: ABC transporter ATP-binding protein [Rhodospirillales bacterium]|nr:ABC transporter ATP-binding protein [Rhodospirillales bacterium]